MMEPAEEFDMEIPDIPVDATQAVRRALVLAAVVCRGFIEEHIGVPEIDALPDRMQTWLTQLNLWDAVEPIEKQILHVPLGQLFQEQVIQATWSVEGLAVLAWALKLGKLPRHDQEVEPCEVAERVWFLCEEAEELIQTAKLRKHKELEACRELHYAIHTRLRQFRRHRTKMDFTRWVEKSWTNALRLDTTHLIINQDLAIDGKEIGEVDYARVQTCEQITLERHRATIWLMGEYPVYSELPVDT